MADGEGLKVSDVDQSSISESSSTDEHQQIDYVKVNGANGYHEKDIQEDKNSSNSLGKIASYKELILFISTTIIIWLSEPLLSLVDTTIVGKFASNSKNIIQGVAPETIQLAALGPATMLCDNAFYLTYFLAMATTNQLATASAKNDEKLQVKTTSHALGVASILGLIISAVIFTSGGTLLQYILGSEGAMVNGLDLTKPVINFSWDYTKIRGILAPLTIMGMIAQSVSLATLDTRTPALAVLVASIVNVVGDIFLVAKVGMGLRGAAIATAAAGAASSLVLIRESKRKVDKWQKSDTKEKRPFVSLPDPKSFISLVKLAGPIFFVILGKLVCYSAMTLKASDFGMLSLTTHNIMLRVFFFFCTFGDSFSLAAQSFLPKVLYGNSEVSTTETNEIEEETRQAIVPKENTDVAKTLLKRIFTLASAMALTNSNLARQILKRGGSFFTNDSTILQLLGDPARVFYLMGSVLLHPLIMTMEGSILATRDLGFLVSAYFFTMGTMLSLLKFSTNSFTEVWRALFTFQAIRTITFGARVFQKTRSKKKTRITGNA
ncbi:hypothetical protein CTEN210_10966 [Chaetoceros tenuissimus]|uniref:Multidrug and toxic compound extrusion protein n=1 Tax=Chaetoceros tenuissimus TaxID=426638 RepID=A0AAD3D0W9_9STRA|nr:hypothetical protein CTEN210_10966 [Chaetoceros tenuissimus]